MSASARLGHSQSPLTKSVLSRTAVQVVRVGEASCRGHSRQRRPGPSRVRPGQEVKVSESGRVRDWESKGSTRELHHTWPVVGHSQLGHSNYSLTSLCEAEPLNPTVTYCASGATPIWYLWPLPMPQWPTVPQSMPKWPTLTLLSIVPLWPTLPQWPCVP